MADHIGAVGSMLGRIASNVSLPEGYSKPRRTSTTLSRSSSMFSWHATEKKDAPSERRIVVFDPLERKLWVDTKENLQEQESGKFTRVPIKGTETKVSVYQELGSGKNTAKVFIATVDLGKLGKDVKAQRRKMRMQHLYVLGQVPVGFGPVPEQDEEEQ